MTSSSKVPYLNSPRTGTTSRRDSNATTVAYPPVTLPLLSSVHFARPSPPEYRPRPRTPSHLHSLSRASSAHRAHEPLFPPHTAKGSFPGTWFGTARAVQVQLGCSRCSKCSNPKGPKFSAAARMAGFPDPSRRASDPSIGPGPQPMATNITNCDSPWIRLLGKWLPAVQRRWTCTRLQQIGANLSGGPCAQCTSNCLCTAQRLVKACIKIELPATRGDQRTCE
jgi:hypothetical protein